MKNSTKVTTKSINNELFQTAKLNSLKDIKGGADIVIIGDIQAV